MLAIEGLHLRAALFRSIRSYFFGLGFLEVDTPLRYPILIPEQHIVPVPSGDWFLQPSPEQCMKRLLARGCPLIFQICPCFRAEEQGRLHLTEFTMLEWYRRGADYNDLMADCEGLIAHVLAELQADDRFAGVVGRSSIGACPPTGPWQRLTVREAFSRYCRLSAEQALADDLFDELLVEAIEPRLGIQGPTFLIDYPAACASLARLKAEDPTLAERFELYIDGIELANGFSELTDAEEQRRRFVNELNERQEKSATPASLPERFLEELSTIGPAAGIALGVDRLLMILAAARCISDVVSFAPDDLI